MKKKQTVLVTGCGGDIGQSIAKILRQSEWVENLFGIDISDKNPAQFIFPNFSLGIPVNAAEYAAFLTDFVEKNQIDLIIPIAEPELRFYSQNKHLRQIGKAKILMASDLAMEVGFDKFQTAEFLKENDLPFPHTQLAQDFNPEASYPVVLKSRIGSGSKDIHILRSAEDFNYHTRKNKEAYIVQEFISNESGEYTCGLYRSRKGEIRSQIFKRELHGGYSGYGKVVNNESITKLLRELAVKLDLVGSINVQLRLDGEIPKVFEINPRFSSTVFFRHLFGFEDVIWSIEDLIDSELSPYTPTEVGRKFYKGFAEYIN